MFAVATVAVLVAMLLAVVRAIRGPTVFDRVLAGNTIGTLAILLLAVVSFLTGRPEWLDIGLDVRASQCHLDTCRSQVLPPWRPRL